MRIDPAREMAQGNARSTTLSHRGMRSAIPHKWGLCAEAQRDGGAARRAPPQWIRRAARCERRREQRLRRSPFLFRRSVLMPMKSPNTSRSAAPPDMIAQMLAAPPWWEKSACGQGLRHTEPLGTPSSRAPTACPLS